jgi:hypothetical protein
VPATICSSIFCAICAAMVLRSISGFTTDSVSLSAFGKADTGSSDGSFSFSSQGVIALSFVGEYQAVGRSKSSVIGFEDNFWDHASIDPLGGSLKAWFFKLIF